MNSFFNTSPLIFLEKLKLIDRLLPKLWDKIYITNAVVQEVNDKGITDRFFFQEYNIKNKVEKKIMTAEEAIINLEKLRKKSFWVTDELFGEIIGKLEDLRM